MRSAASSTASVRARSDIVLSRVGRIGPLIWYMPLNANIAFRELGIVLFLACVGLKAGEHFFATVITPNGLVWLGAALCITMLPLLVVGVVARRVFQINFMSLTGLIAGSMTDPPALAFAGQADHLPARHAAGTIADIGQRMRVGEVLRVRVLGGEEKVDAARAWFEGRSDVASVTSDLSGELEVGFRGNDTGAAALLAANEVWQLGWPSEELAELSSEIGSDIPFFFFTGPPHFPRRCRRE